MTEYRTRPPARLVAALFLLAACGALVLFVLTPEGSRERAIVGQSLVTVLAGSCAFAVWRWSRGPGAWVSGPALAAMFALTAATTGAFLVNTVAERAWTGPTPYDAAFLVLLLPVLWAARREFVAHFPPDDRREIAIDVLLIAASLAAVCYVVILPNGRSPAEVSRSAGTFALIATTVFTIYGALAIWVPSPAHLIQWVVFTSFAGAIVAFGWEWSQGIFTGLSTTAMIPFLLGPAALTATVGLLPRRTATGPGERPLRLARPLLTSLSVACACVAFVTVASLDEVRGIDGAQATAIITILGAGVAFRILANQLRSTQAHQATQAALAEKASALSETDAALQRLREVNETLRQSEEHLRLVVEAAVDGIVELDERGTIVRANDAFGRMVHLDRGSIEGQPWSALAASIAGADASFAALPTTGQGTIQRPEGQPLFLESRISDVPMTPPRRLLLIRDVTAGRVADQTIRSLFQFLQDRDEDRTRLLRRTEAAIEAERNRIARDLHDGPVQGVSAASLSLEAALLMVKAGEAERGMEVLAKIRRELAEEADGLRRLMAGLRPPVLEERGLIPALREILTRFEEDHDLTVTFSGSLGAQIPDDLETLAYRVVQEALSNVAKHADARAINVAVGSDQQLLHIEITDDGCGFDANARREFLRMGHFGLASMQERVELASGTLVVRSTPGRGTTILATLPVDESPVGRVLAVSDATPT
jgi:signal transduction histidine kinase